MVSIVKDDGGSFCMDVNDASTRASWDYHYNKSKRVSGLGSHDPKYYNEIITKVSLQARKQQHEHLIRDQSATSRKKVLLVDDEPDICMVYQMTLEDAGYECISYTDPVKALQEFRIGYYDLILLDIRMPILNGFELCKKIIELDRTVHIVFTTATEQYYEKFRSQHFPELGKINYIQKPIGNDGLVQIVDRIGANSITMD